MWANFRLLSFHFRLSSRATGIDGMTCTTMGLPNIPLLYGWPFVRPPEMKGHDHEVLIDPIINYAYEDCSSCNIYFP